MASTTYEGIIHTDEAYSKKMVLNRLGISQKFWEFVFNPGESLTAQNQSSMPASSFHGTRKMLDEGLPYTTVGDSRWVTGENLPTSKRRQSISVGKRKGKQNEQIFLGAASVLQVRRKRRWGRWD